MCRKGDDGVGCSGALTEAAGMPRIACHHGDPQPQITRNSQPFWEVQRMKPNPIKYLLIVQCIRPEIGIMAEYVASTPFPNFQEGGHLELLDCNPTTWDVTDTVQRITAEKDGAVVCATLLLADSPVVENTGFVVKKQSGEEIGPSESRFGRLPN
jgi:hypothetical protein